MYDSKPADLAQELQTQTPQDQIRIPTTVIKQLNQQISFAVNLPFVEEIHQLLVYLQPKLTGSGELLARQKLTVFIAGEVQRKELITIDVEKILAENRAAASDSKISRPDLDVKELLTHLDLLRILTGIIRLVRQEDASFFTNWTTVDDQDLWILKNWLTNYDGKFDEVELVRKKSGELRKLFEEVLSTLSAFYAKRTPPDFSFFVDEATTQTEFFELLANEIISQIPNYTAVENWDSHQTERKKLLEAINEFLRNEQYFDQFFTSQNISTLNELRLRSPQNTFHPDLLTSKWYEQSEQQELRKKLAEQFVSKHGQALSDEHISPLLQKPAEPTPASATQAEQETEGDGESQPVEEDSNAHLTLSEFADLLLRQATEQLIEQLITEIATVNPVVQNFSQTDAVLFRSLISTRVSPAITQPEFFHEQLRAHWMQLVTENGGFFHAQQPTQTESETITQQPEYLVVAGFEQQQAMVDLIARFVATQAPSVRTTIEPEIVRYIMRMEEAEEETQEETQQPESEETTAQQPPAEESTPITPPPAEPATAAVPTPPPAPPEPIQPTLDPESEAKLFYATRSLLTTVMLSPLANEQGITIGELNPALLQELQTTAELFLRQNQRDLRLSPSERLALIREFRQYLQTKYRPTDTTGLSILQLLQRQSDDSLYTRIDKDLLNIANFDNTPATIVLKQKIDAFLLSASQQELDFLQKLDFTIELDRNRFLQIIQLPVSANQPISREIEQLLAAHPRLAIILKNYIVARAAELDLAVQTKESRSEKNPPQSEAAKLLATTQTAQTHDIIQSLAAHGRFSDEGAAAESAGKVVGKSKQENLTDRANWLLKQNQQQYGAIWKILTQEQQAAIYAQIEAATGIPQIVPLNYDPPNGYPLPTGIGAVSIADILNQLKQARKELLTTDDVFLIDQLERTQQSNEYKLFLLEDQLQQQLVADFLAELDADVLAAMSSELAEQQNLEATLSLAELQERFSFESLSQNSLKSAEQLDTAQPYKRNLFSRLSGYKPQTRTEKTQAASKKALNSTASLAKTGKMLAQMTSLAGVANAGLQVLLNPSKENIKRFFSILGAFAAPYLPLLFSAGAQIGFGLGAVVGGVATWLTGGTLALPIMFGTTAAGTWLGLRADQFINGAKNVFAGNTATTTGSATTVLPTTPAAPVGNVAAPKHAVQPRFAPQSTGTGTQAATTASTQQAATQVRPVNPTTATTATTTGTLATIAALPVAVLAPAIFLFSITTIGFITIIIIFSAFLIPLPGSDYKAPPLVGFEGCWPTTGNTKALYTYEGGGTHNVYDTAMQVQIDSTGTVRSYPQPATALDILYNQQGHFPKIYAPFSGFASFYPFGTGKSKQYGNHIVIATPSFAIVLAHLQDFNGEEVNGPTYRPVVAGEELGTMGSTGTSDFPHVHYEVIGGPDILDLLPITPADREKYRANESSMWGLPVSAQDCAIPNQGNGFLAVGPATSSNFEVSSTAEIAAPPTTSCSWHNTRGLAASTNANFYNTPYIPIGIAGTSPAKYYANADDRDASFINQLNSLVVNSSGEVEMVRPDPALATSLRFPVDLPQYSKGVTGIFVSGGSSDNTVRERTAIGLGISNGRCETTYKGEKVIFLAVMPEATYAMIEQALAKCGAQEFAHLDGGSSSTFCSNNITFDRSKPVSVHVGLKEAVVTRFGESTTPQPSPP